MKLICAAPRQTARQGGGRGAVRGAGRGRGSVALIRTVGHKKGFYCVPMLCHLWPPHTHTHARIDPYTHTHTGTYTLWHINVGIYYINTHTILLHMLSRTRQAGKERGASQGHVSAFVLHKKRNFQR